MFELVFDYGERLIAEQTRAVIWRRGPAATGPVLHLSRRLRGSHLPALPPRADVPRLSRRLAGRRSTLPRPLARSLVSHDPGGRRQQRPGLQLPAQARRSGATSATRGTVASPSSCRRSSSATAKRRSTTRVARFRRRVAREPARRARRRLPVDRSRRRRPLRHPHGAGGRLVLQAQPRRRPVGPRSVRCSPVALAAVRRRAQRRPPATDGRAGRRRARSRRLPPAARRVSRARRAAKAGSRSSRSRVCPTSTGTTPTCASSISPATATPTC